MGLDMYLTKEVYIGTADNREMWGQADAEIKVNGVNPDKVKTVSEEAAYWRKANAIHNWFVERCQDGVDECQRTWITVEQLQELLDEVTACLDNRELAEQKLPTVEGFFFGSQDYDEWYWKDMEYTRDTLEEILKDHEKLRESKVSVDYYYQSSW